VEEEDNDVMEKAEAAAADEAYPEGTYTVR